MRVARISTRLACGLAAILLLGVSGAAAVGILLGGEGRRSTDAAPGHGAPRVPGAASKKAVEPDSQPRRTPGAERGPSEVLLSLK